MFLNNLLNPAILLFLLGFLIKAVNSKLQLSKGLSHFLSVYLVVAIGFSGGCHLLTSESFGKEFFIAASIGLLSGFLLPILAFKILRKISFLDHKTLAAVAAHYGSVSLVTFITATAFLKVNNIEFPGYLTAILALMESPAIFSGLVLAHSGKKERSSWIKVIKTILHEVKKDGIILLLIGSFIVGLITGEAGFAKMSGFIEAPFYGVLALFLFDMGLKVGENVQDLKQANLKLVLFGCYMPIIGASIMLTLTSLAGLSFGAIFLMMVLGASASYIAVPAVMRLALPEAQAAIYLPMSLAITFPFNVLVGIPLYYQLASLTTLWLK